MTSQRLLGEVAQAADKATSKTTALSFNKVSDNPRLREEPLRGLDILRFTQIIGLRLRVAGERSRNLDHPQVGCGTQRGQGSVAMSAISFVRG